jgi:Fe-S oxidoreductase
MNAEEFDAAVRSCRHCPMCHHADLTMTLTQRETYSARGRGLALFALQSGKLRQDEDLGDVLYSFFADGLCQHVCAGHIPHDEMVIEARRRAVAAGSAPEAVAQVKANIERTGNPWGNSEPDLVTLTGGKPRRDLLVYFGSAARIRRQGSVTALVGLLRAAEVDFSVLPNESDPGLLLYQLGEAEAGSNSARALAHKIAESGARMVVTPDADAYRTLKLGVGDCSPTGIDVQHVSEFLAGLADRLKFRAPLLDAVAYHDPCALARFAPCLEAPRAFLSSICAKPPLEIGAWSRELAHCSGECGGVAFTQPALARRAAERRVREARDAGAKILVAGSPASASMLEPCGLKVRDLSEFVMEAL